MKNISLPLNNNANAFSTLSKGCKKRLALNATRLMKVPALLALVLSGLTVKSQMAGPYTVPGSFPTLAAAVSSLNSVGLNASVIINVAAGHTETVPVGGIVLTASGTGANSISIMKSGAGANPVLSAYSGGLGTPATAVQDGVFRLIGSDFVTISSIDIVDPNASNPATMEFGYGLFKASATDGCKNITIVNCNIALNRDNNASGVFPAAHGSRGIDVVNALASAHTTSLTVTAASGANSNLGFFNNTITNCNYGVVLNGFADVAPFTFSDSGNNMSGNTVNDFGGALNATNPAAAFLASAQQNINITGNQMNSNTGAGVNHLSVLHGVHVYVAGGTASSISGNTVTLHGGGTSAQLTAVEAAGITGVTGATLNINGNHIKDCTYGSATSGGFYGIFNSSACELLSISGNNFINNSTAGNSGEYFNIYNSGAVTGSVMVNGNQIHTADFTAASVSSTVSNIYCSNGASTAYVGISGNTIQNTNFLGANGATGPYYGIMVAANTSTVYGAGNTFINLSLKSTGAVHLIHVTGSIPEVSFFGNSIGTGFARTLSSGDTYFYYGNNTATTGSATISFNTGNTISQSGTSAFYGIHNTALTQQQAFEGNTFTQITSGTGLIHLISMTGGNSTLCRNNTLNTIVTSGDVYGIHCNSGLAYNRIFQNSINGFSVTGAATVYPVYVAPSSSAKIYRNKIYDMEVSHASGAAFGIYIAAGATLAAQSDTIYNNLIGDLRTPLSNAAMPIAGIYVGGGTKVYVWHNSVHLDASSTSTLFGSAALFASTSIDLELKNNILVNESVVAGTGISAAYRRSSSNLQTYLAGSDNNLFYAGNIAPVNAIYYDGTTAYSYLSAYKTLVSGRDLVSVTENPPFVSVLGSSSNFLDINPAVATQVESGATPIAFVTSDYAALPRNATTPDIGAWENTFTAAGDWSSPVLHGSGFITSNCNTTSRTLTLTLTDGSGVAAGAQAPKVYYKVNAGTFSNVQGTLLSGTALNGVWSFNLNYTAVGSDVISYYLVAQDIATTSNLLASPADGFAGTDVNTIVTPPTQLETYTILPSPVIVTNSLSVCMGSSVALTPTVTGAATFVWTGPSGFNASTQTVAIAAASSTSAGVYTLTANSVNNCSATATVSLSVNAVPVVSVNSSSLAICAGETASLSASGADTYVWTPGALTTQVINVSPASTTIYSVVGTNTAGCTNLVTVNVVVNVCTGLAEKQVQALSAYPNPGTGLFTVKTDAVVKSLLVTDMMGRIIMDLAPQSNSIELDLTREQNGIYFLKVQSQDQQIIQRVILSK